MRTLYPTFLSLAALAAAMAAPLHVTAAQDSPATRPSSTAPPPAGWSRGERWQAALHDGSYLWELTPTGLRGDTLVARQADTLVLLPLERLDELRLVRASVKRVGGGPRGTFAGLAGADDAVYTLTRYPLAERRRIVAELLAAHPPGGDPRGAAPARP